MNLMSKTDLHNYCIAIYRLSWCEKGSNMLTHFLTYYYTVNDKQDIFLNESLMFINSIDTDINNVNETMHNVLIVK